MKLSTVNGSESRRVLIGMITDGSVLGRIASRWTREGLFASAAENLIGGWCASFYGKFRRAPGREIQTRYEQWADSGRGDSATIQGVGKILGSISDEYDRNGDAPTPDVTLDVAGRLFNRVKLKRLSEQIQADLEAGDVEKAESRIADMRPVELGVGEVIRPGEDAEFWAFVFDDNQMRPLVWYPGPLGQFVNSVLVRDAFVALTGPAKRGKSFWLLDMAFMAVTGDHHRVAYFEGGDLSRRQIGMRLGQRALRRTRPGGSKVVKWPVKFINHDELETEDLELSEVTQGECQMAWKKAQRGRDLFRLSCHSNSSLSVSHVESMIKRWDSDGWTPDVIVIDYADILAPPLGIREPRDQINENWKAMRRISQDWHCLVLTATQGDAASYDAKVMRKKNFSDDRRKHDHVTAMIGLNASDADKSRGVMRLNFVDRREGAYVESEQMWVAGCPEVARMAVCSSF